MQQSGGMYVFNHACQEDVVRPVISGKAGAENQQEWTNPLAAAVQDMSRDGID
jgi:hypothetical protein